MKGQALRFSRPFPAACQGQRFTGDMYRDGPHKNHSVCYHRAHGFGSLNPLRHPWPGKLGWAESHVNCSKDLCPGYAGNLSGLDQKEPDWPSWSLVPRSNPGSQGLITPRPEEAVRDGLKEMPKYFSTSEGRASLSYTYIQALSGQRMGSGGSHRSTNCTLWVRVSRGRGTQSEIPERADSMEACPGSHTPRYPHPGL